MAFQDRFEGMGKSLKKMFFAALAIAVPLFGSRLIWPQVDVKILSMQTSQSSGTLILERFTLENHSYLTVMDFEIDCDMKGPSGSAITTAKKVLYDALASGGARTYAEIVLGPIPEQATQFDCYVKSASIDW